jgi:hypothetical protein
VTPYPLRRSYDLPCHYFSWPGNVSNFQSSAPAASPQTLTCAVSRFLHGQVFLRTLLVFCVQPALHRKGALVLLIVSAVKSHTAKSRTARHTPYTAICDLTLALPGVHAPICLPNCRLDLLHGQDLTSYRCNAIGLKKKTRYRERYYGRAVRL